MCSAAAGTFRSGPGDPVHTGYDPAVIALDGMLAEQLYIIPQLDGRIVWRAKRLLGGSFHRGLGYLAKSGLVEKVAGR